MRIPSQQHRKPAGALMAAALMLMVVIGIFISGWISLMNIRATQVSFMEDFVRRRVALESSRLIGRQLTYDAAFRRNHTLPGNADYVFGSDIGSINSDNGWTNLNIYGNTIIPGASLSTVYPYNSTGLRPGSTYYSSEKLVRPNDGVSGIVDAFTSWHFLKTMPPLLCGDIFCIYRKPDGVVTELDVHTNSAAHHAQWIVQGRTVVRYPPSLFVASTPSPLRLPFQTRSLYIQTQTATETTLTHPVYGSGIGSPSPVLLPSNLSAVPSTTGPITNNNTPDRRYDGYLNVIKNDHNTDNSLWHFQDREAAAGRTATTAIQVFNASASPQGDWAMFSQPTPPQTQPTYPPADWPNGYDSKLRVLTIRMDSPNLKNMRIYGVVDQIILQGQSNAGAFAAAAAMKPVIFTIMPNGPGGRWVRDIRFERENARRFVLAFQDTLGRPVELNWVNNPIDGNDYRWRCALVNEHHSLFFNMPSSPTRNVRIIGGVMTNWTIKRRAAGGINASRLTFVPDTDSSVAQTAPATGPAWSAFLPRDAWQENYLSP